MISIRNKRLMSYGEGVDNNIPTVDDFTFFGGGKGGGGGGIVVIKQKAKPVPKAPEQATASNVNDTDIATEDDELIGGGTRKSLGGTRKLAIPVTASR